MSDYRFKATPDELRAQGYTVENSKIDYISLTMEENGCLTSWIGISGECCCALGGYCLGHGYLGAKKFQGSSIATEYLMQVMDIVGVSKWEDLKGEYVRVAHKGFCSKVNIIGNITENKWFNQEEFFNQKIRGE